MRAYYDIESGAPLSHSEGECPMLPDVLKWETMGKNSVWAGFYEDSGRELFGVILTETYNGKLSLALSYIYGADIEGACALVDSFLQNELQSIISEAALRASLKRIYSGSDVYISADDDLVKERTLCLDVYKQIITNVDLNSARDYVFFANCECYDNKQQLALVPDSQADLWFGSFPGDLERSADRHTALDSYTNYILSSEEKDKTKLLELTEKYGKYIEDQSVNKAEYIYSAFIEGNIDYLMDLCYKYAVDMHDNGKEIVFESGVRALLSSELKNHLVIKIIYNGYKDSKLSELLVSNSSETAFCSAVREVGELFENEEIEYINKVLLANAQSGSIENQLTVLEKLESEHNNAFELGMINTYRRCVESALALADTEKSAEDTLDSDEIDELLDDAPEELKIDETQPLLDDTDGFNALLDSELDVKEGIEEAQNDLTAELFEAISKMDIGSYTAVYEHLISSETDKTEILSDYFVSKLSLLLDSYQSIKSEFEAQENISENEALKLLLRERIADIRTLALEECSDDGVFSIVEKFDESEIEPSLFYPAMYSRICKMAIKKESCDFIDELRQKTENVHLKAVLLAAKFSCQSEGEPPYFLIELQELAENYEFLKSCLPGDIVFNANIKGARYCSVSLDLYVQAIRGQLDEKGRIIAENSVEINNFLADMGIDGYQKITLVPQTAEEPSNNIPVIPPENDLQPKADDKESEDPENDIINHHDKISEVSNDTDDLNGKKTSFEEPQSFRVLLKKENTEKMRATVIALSCLTILLVVLLIILLNGGFSA